MAELLTEVEGDHVSEWASLTREVFRTSDLANVGKIVPCIIVPVGAWQLVEPGELHCFVLFHCVVIVFKHALNDLGCEWF